MVPSVSSFRHLNLYIDVTGIGRRALGWLAEHTTGMRTLFPSGDRPLGWDRNLELGKSIHEVINYVAGNRQQDFRTPGSVFWLPKVFVSSTYDRQRFPWMNKSPKDLLGFMVTENTIKIIDMIKERVAFIPGVKEPDDDLYRLVEVFGNKGEGKSYALYLAMCYFRSQPAEETYVIYLNYSRLETFERDFKEEAVVAFANNEAVLAELKKEYESSINNFVGCLIDLVEKFSTYTPLYHDWFL